MKLQLLSTEAIETHSRGPKRRRIRAADIFKSCPACHSTDLIAFEGEVLCCQCPWDSLQASVDTGLMDSVCGRPARQAKRQAKRQTSTTENPALPANKPNRSKNINAVEKKITA